MLCVLPPLPRDVFAMLRGLNAGERLGEGLYLCPFVFIRGASVADNRCPQSSVRRRGTRFSKPQHVQHDVRLSRHKVFQTPLDDVVIPNRILKHVG